MSINLLPFSSQNLPVSTELPPFEFCPDVESGWYHWNNLIIASNVVWDNAVAERLLLRVTIDKGDYLTAVGLAGYAGNFDINFQEITICITNTVPTALPVCTETLGSLTTTDSATEYNADLIIRAPESWQSQNRYINFVIRFNHNGQDDYVVVPFKVYTSPQNYDRYTDSAPFTQLQLVKGGVVVDELCSDGAKGVIEVWADHDQVGAVALAVLRRDNVYISEYDGFDSTNLPKLVESPFISMESVLIGGGQREIIRINENLINGGECVYVVIKPEEGLVGPEPPTCEDVFDVGCTFGLMRVGGTVFVTVAYEIDPVFANLEQITLTAEMGGCTDGETYFTNSGGSTFFNCNPTGSTNIMTITVEVLLENGCTYTESHTFTVNWTPFGLIEIDTEFHTFEFA
jgi:hypothetical protein